MEPPREPPDLDRSFGREAFGADPSTYHAARPAYPQATWEALRVRANLSAGIDVLEVGAGTGLATAPLLAHGPARLVAVEPDVRLAGFLRSTIIDPRLQVVVAAFEDADLPRAAFDLVASATAFHWLDAVPALRRVRDVLRPGGSVGLWWNVFGDPGRADRFHDATRHLFAGHPTSPSAGGDRQPPHALDASARVRELTKAGFDAHRPQFIEWTLTLDPTGVRRLYETYSNVAALAPPERSSLLAALEDIATREFSGRVERNMTTAIYTARRMP